MPRMSPGRPVQGAPAIGVLWHLLPGGRGRRRRVAILGHGGVVDRVEGWLEALLEEGDVGPVTVLATAPLDLPLRDGVRMRPAGVLAELTTGLRHCGAVDAVVSLLDAAHLPVGCPDHPALLRAVLPYLARNGVLAHDRVAAPDGGLPLARVLDHPEATLDDVGTVTATRELVAVSQRHRRLLLLREADVPALLEEREPELAVEELEALAEGHLAARTTVHHHGGEPSVAPLPRVLHHPRLSTRHYRGPVMLSGRTLMWSGSTILPDSFRWHLAEQLGNPHLDGSVVADTARIRPRLVPQRVLEGDFFQLESTYPSHFGHVLTEVVSRLWGWDAAKRRLPGLRLLHHPRPDVGHRVEREIFAAFGIADEDVVAVRGPVEVGSVVSASPMWHNAAPHYVHPGIAEVWDRIGAGLRRHESGLETAARIFVSRSESGANNGRACRNLREVERRFAAHGFRVVYPERHPLADQARLFREARVVAGFGGSALFNLMHTRSLEALVVLNSSSYFARNEHLFASVKGGESHYFWSAPDQPPADPLSREALRASWRFDVEHLGGELDVLLSGL